MKAPNFSLPNNVPDGDPVNMGWVWMGNKPCTQADVQHLADWLGEQWGGEVKPEHLVLDPFALSGKRHILYTTYWCRATGAQATGGAGSVAYETKRTGDGVLFAKTEIWHYDAEGDLVNALPANCGAYHVVDVGGGYQDIHAGPAPGSEAEALLGKGYYRWSKNKLLYMIEA